MLRGTSRALIPFNRRIELDQSGNCPSLIQAPRRNFLIPVDGQWNPVLRNLDSTIKDLNRKYRQVESVMNNTFLHSVLSPMWTSCAALAPLSNRFQFDSVPVLESEIVGNDDQKRYRMNVYLGQDFCSDHIKLTLKDRLVTVEAKAEQKLDDGQSWVYQQVTRSFNLPEKVDLKDVKSVLTADGVLQIEVPAPKHVIEMKPTEIPIEIC